MLYFVALAAGGLITSFIEFKLQYNLFDYIDDAFHGIGHALTKAESKVKSLVEKL